MINYGVVYPQAILVFVMTLLYSVVQPLIVMFGAIYFGVAYVVYKYKLLFGKQHHLIRKGILLNSPSSVLQTLRIAGTSMGYNIYPIDLGCRHVPGIHDRDIRSQKGIHCFLVGDAPPRWDDPVVVVHHQDLYSVERACQFEFRVRGGERRRYCRSCKVKSWSPSNSVTKVSSTCRR